jgi:hypothetical protein
MTTDKVRRVVEAYQQQLAAQGVVPVRYVTSGVLPSPTVALGHLSWMLGEIQGMLETGADAEKIHRWLGFVQGVLWLAGQKTIDQMRDDNRS